MRTNRYLVNHGHIHRFTVSNEPEGWEVTEEEDSAVLRRAHHEDWHRVEMAAQFFEIRALALKRQGWTETS